MSDQSGPEAGTEPHQAASAAEPLRIRQPGAEQDRSLSELERQQYQLQNQLASYERQARLARQSDQEHLARQALAEYQRLYPYLLSLQQQIEQLKRQRASLTAQEAVQAGPDDAPRAAPPAGDWLSKLPPPKRRSWPLLLVLCGLAVLMVLTPLVLLLMQRASQQSAPLAQQTSTPATPTLTPTPAETPSFFTPNGTAPTSQDCKTLSDHACYSPEQIQQAFRLNSLYSQDYTGAGQTIVILGTGKTTTLKSDLHTFDQAWGLPDPTFTIQQPFGALSPYTCAGGEDALQAENTLDVEWAHAIAPGANITLLIGSNDSGGPPEANCAFAGIAEALAYAINQHLGSIISMSYGGSELGDIAETASDKARDKVYYDSAHQLFQQAAAEGITVLASTGDQGVTNPNGGANSGSVWTRPNIQWPSSDPYVLAVGGTTLTLRDENGGYGSESAWNDSGGSTGGGLSVLYNEPSYQQSVSNQLLQGKRGVPDVAFPAAINYALYGSFSPGELGQAKPQWNHWHIIGGTSASAPCWAGLIAIANQMRGGPLGFIQPALYSLRGQGMHDITVGNNTLDGVQGYSAQSGYDLVTGWGTPIAEQLLPALVQAVNRLATGCGSLQRQCR